MEKLHNKWVNCCRGRKNCPKVTVDTKGRLRIKDDDGNEIRITLEQLRAIVVTIDALRPTNHH